LHTAFCACAALEIQACAVFSFGALRLDLRVPYTLQLEENWPPGPWVFEQSCCAHLPSQQTQHLHVPILNVAMLQNQLTKHNNIPGHDIASSTHMLYACAHQGSDQTGHLAKALLLPWVH